MTSQSVKRYLDIPGKKASSLAYKMPSHNNRSAMINQEEVSFDARSQDSHIEKVVRSYSSISQVSNPYSKVKDKY